MTKISERTIRYNIAKIGEQDSVEHRSGNGRPRKMTPESRIVIGQWIRKNNEITTKEIVENLQDDRNPSVSRWMELGQLHRMGYKSILPRATPMLTKEGKERHVSIRTMTIVAQYSSTKAAFSYSKIRSVDSPRNLGKSSKGFLRTDRTSWCGVLSVSK
jgi:transposase